MTRVSTAIKKIAFSIKCRSYLRRSRLGSYPMQALRDLQAALDGILMRASSSRTSKNSCAFFLTLLSNHSNKTIFSVWSKICTWASAPATSSAKTVATIAELKTNSATCSCPSRMSLSRRRRTSLSKKLSSSISALRHSKGITPTIARAVIKKLPRKKEID